MYSFYSDIHKFGADPTKVEIVEGDKTFLMGDIVDLKNCLNNDYDKAKALYNDLHFKFGRRYITGNHEAMKDTDKPHFINSFTALLHGDCLIYGRQESDLVRQAKHTRGNVSRFFKKLFSKSREVVNFKAEKTPNDQIFMDAIITLKFNNPLLKRVLIGHTHILKLTKIIYPSVGIEVWFLPRGLTTFNDNEIEQY